MALAIAAQACGGDSGPTPTAATTGAGDSVTVVHRNFSFEPERLSFQVGETVEFRLTSEDSPHTFTIRDLGISWAVSKDSPEVQSFTFEEPGTFRLVCAIPGHEGLGMTGTVEVR